MVKTERQADGMPESTEVRLNFFSH